MGEELSLTRRITTCHQQLDEIFLLHQEALLQGHLQAAADILDAFNTCHTLHMNFEDKVLLPMYADLEEQGKWNATLYHQEHQKIQDLYGRIEEGLQWLIKQSLDPSQLRRNIINLLDREKSFKGLCEHHQEREEASLLVELDRQCDENWRIEAVNSFSQEWEQKLEIEMQSIKDLL